MKEIIIKGGSWDEATKKRLNASADKWRLPYWDWAAGKKKTGSYQVPSMANGATINVYRPDGQLETPPNPMFSYSPGTAFKDVKGFPVELNSNGDPPNKRNPGRNDDNAVRVASCPYIWTIADISQVWLQ